MVNTTGQHDHPLPDDEFFGDWQLLPDHGRTADFGFKGHRPRPRPRLEIEPLNGVLIVRFPGTTHLGHDNVDELASPLFSLMERPAGLKKMLLNLRYVEGLDAAALGKLIALDKKMRTFGGKLCLCNLGPVVYEVFTITRLDEFFDIRVDETKALERF